MSQLGFGFCFLALSAADCASRQARLVERLPHFAAPGASFQTRKTPLLIETLAEKSTPVEMYGDVCKYRIRVHMLNCFRKAPTSDKKQKYVPIFAKNIHIGITLLSGRPVRPTSNQIEWTRSITLPVILPNDFISYQLSLLCRCPWLWQCRSVSVCPRPPFLLYRPIKSARRTHRYRYTGTRVHRYTPAKIHRYIALPWKPSEPDSCA